MINWNWSDVTSFEGKWKGSPFHKVVHQDNGACILGAIIEPVEVCACPSCSICPEYHQHTNTLVQETRRGNNFINVFYTVPKKEEWKNENTSFPLLMVDHLKINYHPWCIGLLPCDWLRYWPPNEVTGERSSTSLGSRSATADTSGSIPTEQVSRVFTRCSPSLLSVFLASAPS